jgi:hypothetical protein
MKEDRSERRVDVEEERVEPSLLRLIGVSKLPTSKRGAGDDVRVVLLMHLFLNLCCVMKNITKPEKINQ